MAATHADREALKLMLRELPQAGTSMAPGLGGAVGGRPEPTPVIRHCAFLIDKTSLRIEIDLDGKREVVGAAGVSSAPLVLTPPQDPVYPALSCSTRLPLIALAHGRSGDKGDQSNIGILAREPRFVPIIGAGLSADAVARHMAHVLDPARGRVRRYQLPGCNGWNFVLEHALGGGGIASLRADPQGKGYAQQLLAFELPVPEPIYGELAAQLAAREGRRS
jgi:hypothetical protein